MARGRAANGSGMQPRKRKDGTWEARFTVGADPTTGKTIRKSVYGKTAQEVAEKLRAATASIDAGTYLEPKTMPLSAWLEIWLNEYCGGIKPGTLKTYGDNVKNHIFPGLGAVRLCDLQPHTVQTFVNGLQRGRKPLSPKTVRNIHGTLCKALSEAARVRYIASNPAAGCILPKLQRGDISPFEVDEIRQFSNAIHGNPSEDIFFVALNTGMRLSEILGLRWSRVDFKKGTIKVDAQMLFKMGAQGERKLGPTKNGSARTFKSAPVVMERLRDVQRRQMEMQLHAGPVWCNPLDLVFTNAIGQEIPHTTVEHRFRQVMKAIGIEGHRFHDLRHTFATEAIRAGVDVKTVSEMLGHASVAFTLDIYAGVTSAMMEDASSRLQALITTRDGGL